MSIPESSQSGPSRKTAITFIAIMAAVMLAIVATLIATQNSDPSNDTGTQTSTTAPTDPLAAGIQAANNGDTAKAQDLINQSLQETPTAVAAYALALMEDRSGNTEKAIQLYDNALEIDPNYVPALINRARLLLIQDTTAGLDAYERAMTQNPGDVTIATAYARSLIDTGNVEDGTALLQETVQKLTADEAKRILSTYPEEIVNKISIPATGEKQ